MTNKTELASNSPEAQATALPGSALPRDPRELVTPNSAAFVRSINPDNDAVTALQTRRSPIAAELASLQSQAIRSMRAYVFSTIDYVAALDDNAGAPTSIKIKVGHLRRQGLSLNERLDDFIESARQIVSILTNRPKDDLRELSQVVPIAKFQHDSQDISAKLKKLTARENNVLELLIKGLPNKQISYELGISITTAKAHIGAIFRKLNLSNRARVIALLANVDCGANGRFPQKPMAPMRATSHPFEAPY